MSQTKTLFETALTDVGDYTNDRQQGDLEGVGRLRYDEDGNVYRWVRNYHTAAINAGNVVFHTHTDTANAHERVRDGLTADLGFMAGVVMADTAVAADSSGTAGDGDCCWIQVLGYNAGALVLEDTNSVHAVGDTMFGVTAKLYVDGQVPTGLGTAPTHTRCLMLMETITTTDGTPAGVKTNVWVSCFA